MARTRWLDRVRHRPATTPADPRSDRLATLLAAFRADPGATDLRPITKAMTRAVSGWILGHPAVRTAQDAWDLRAALIADPGLADLMHVRVEAQRRMLAEALADGDEVPPLYVVTRLDTLCDGGLDAFLTLLPAGSVLQVDVLSATRHRQLCVEAFAHVRDLGVRTALTGLRADGSEAQAVGSLAPDVLMLDVAAPLDYRDRVEEIDRLRAATDAPGAQVVMGSVSTMVDEWAATVCHADHLTGPLYDREDLSALAAASRETAPDDDRSPYELAAARHPATQSTRDVIVGRLAELSARVCAVGDKADVYLVDRTATGFPADSVGLVRQMLAAGAAVTALSPAFDAMSVDGLMGATLTASEPLARGCAFVALLPGEGHVIAAVDLDDAPDPAPDDGPDDGPDPVVRRESFVDVEDRDLALRLANRISRRAALRHP